MKKIALFSILVPVWLWIDGAALSYSIAMTLSYVSHHYPGVTEFRLIYADGPITPGTANQFLAFIRKKNIGPGAIVLFNSPGGNVAESLEIGRAIRSAKFDTSIGIHGQVFHGECYSACTLSFLGGLRRTIPRQARFGVHRVSDPPSRSATQTLHLGQIALGQIVEYTTSMGVRPEFVTELTRASPDEVTFLSQSTLEELRVISRPFAIP